MKTYHLPRQAQDKHQESTLKNDLRFCSGKGKFSKDFVVPFPRIDNIARFTSPEMKSAVANLEKSFAQGDDAVCYHFTSLWSLGLIFGGHGLCAKRKTLAVSYQNDRLPKRPARYKHICKTLTKKGYRFLQASVLCRPAGWRFVCHHRIAHGA
jgi:hypothetical protein